MRRYEPAVALFSEDDGLADLRQIIEVSWSRLRANGWLYLEHGFDRLNRFIVAYCVGLVILKRFKIMGMIGYFYAKCKIEWFIMYFKAGATLYM